MIEIKFQGNSMENVLRQIVSFTENVTVRETRKAGKHEVQQPRPVFFTDEEKQGMAVGYQYKGKR